MTSPVPPAGSQPGPEYLEQGGGAPLAREPRSGGGGRRKAVLAGATVVGLAAVGAGAWAATSFFATGSQPAEALPASTIGYASIDLDPSGGQKIEAFRMLNKFPAYKDKIGLDADDDIKREIFDRIIAEAPCAGLEYEDDIEPWVGDRAAVAAVDTGEEEPVVAVVVQIKDAAGSCTRSSPSRWTRCAATRTPRSRSSPPAPRSAPARPPAPTPAYGPRGPGQGTRRGARVGCPRSCLDRSRGRMEPMTQALSDEDPGLPRGRQPGSDQHRPARRPPVSVATWYLLDGDRILVNMDGGRKRLDYLREDPRVSLTVLDADDWYKHVSVQGRVVEWRDDEDLSDIDRLARQYGRDGYHNRERPRVSAWIEVEHSHTWGPRSRRRRRRSAPCRWVVLRWSP